MYFIFFLFLNISLYGILELDDDHVTLYRGFQASSAKNTTLIHESRAYSQWMRDLHAFPPLPGRPAPQIVVQKENYFPTLAAIITLRVNDLPRYNHEKSWQRLFPTLKQDPFVSTSKNFFVARYKSQGPRHSLLAKYEIPRETYEYMLRNGLIVDVSYLNIVLGIIPEVPKDYFATFGDEVVFPLKIPEQFCKGIVEIIEIPTTKHKRRQMFNVATGKEEFVRDWLKTVSPVHPLFRIYPNFKTDFARRRRMSMTRRERFSTQGIFQCFKENHFLEDSRYLTINLDRLLAYAYNVQKRFPNPIRRIQRLLHYLGIGNEYKLILATEKPETLTVWNYLTLTYNLGLDLEIQGSNMVVTFTQGQIEIQGNVSDLNPIFLKKILAEHDFVQINGYNCAVNVATILDCYEHNQKYALSGALADTPDFQTPPEEILIILGENAGRFGLLQQGLHPEILEFYNLPIGDEEEDIYFTDSPSMYCGKTNWREWCPPGNYEDLEYYETDYYSDSTDDESDATEDNSSEDEDLRHFIQWGNQRNRM